MSSIKVSALTEITSTTGSEELLINDGGTSKKIQVSNLPDTDTVYTHPNHSGDIVSTGDGATTIQAGAVDIAMLSATGTASGTTFLRGDNTWVVPTDTDTNTNQLTTFTVSATTDTNATTISQGDDLMFTAGTGITCETTADGTVTITNTVTDTDTVYTHPNHSGEVTSTGDGSTVVADNVVDEANLKVSNAPTNGYVLTAQSGASGGLTWAADTNTDTKWDGGTTGLTAATGRTSLGLVIGTDVQAYDADTTKNDVANTFTATQTLKGITETQTTKSASFTPSFTEGTIYSCTAAMTITMPTATAGKSFTVIHATATSITWAGTIKWNGGSAPTADAGIDIYVFTSDGTNWYGMQSGTGFA